MSAIKQDGAVDCVIVGAGPAGLTARFILPASGVACASSVRAAAAQF
ncbi:MAG: hypothetical protein H0V78_11045 [Burkholderiales bacterium]|nr:hypothetical protein [Burkholderiales bacterium]